MDERVRFIGIVTSGALSMSEACPHFGLRRKTDYKWLERDETRVAAGLADKSRAPHSCPWALSSAIARELITARQNGAATPTAPEPAIGTPTPHAHHILDTSPAHL